MLGNVSEYLWDYYVVFGPKVIISDDYCSPSSEWEEEYQRQRTYQMTHVTTEHFWYMRISDLRAMTDDIDEEYVSRNKRIYSNWVGSFTRRESIEKSIYNASIFNDDENFGIRLVRNAE